MTIESLVTPQIDADKIARALVDAAMEDASRERRRATPLPGLEDLTDTKAEAA